MPVRSLLEVPVPSSSSSSSSSSIVPFAASTVKVRQLPEVSC
jgi:hypothetical protein